MRYATAVSRMASELAAVEARDVSRADPPIAAEVADGTSPEGKRHVDHRLTIPWTRTVRQSAPVISIAAFRRSSPNEAIS